MNDIFTMPILISITIFILTTHITPGPTNIILLSSVLSFGYKKSIPFMIANIISYPLMMAFTAFGMGIFLIQNPMIMLFLKVIGVMYLFYMAWKIINSSSSYEDENYIRAKPFTFWQGLIYPWINPKAWIVYSSTLSIYVTSSDKSFLQIVIIILLIFISMIITTYIWSFGAEVLKQFIKNKAFIKKVNISMAVLLVLSIIPILF